jgi:L-fucose mutarotase
MLRFPIIHPPLLAALAACGHGGKVLLGPATPLRELERFEFYAACREPDLAVCVAPGDDRLYANILLTVGFIAPR